MPFSWAPLDYQGITRPSTANDSSVSHRSTADSFFTSDLPSQLSSAQCQHLRLVALVVKTQEHALDGASPKQVNPEPRNNPRSLWASLCLGLGILASTRPPSCRRGRGNRKSGCKACRKDSGFILNTITLFSFASWLRVEGLLKSNIPQHGQDAGPPCAGRLAQCLVAVVSPCSRQRAHAAGTADAGGIQWRQAWGCGRACL